MSVYHASSDISFRCKIQNIIIGSLCTSAHLEHPEVPQMLLDGVRNPESPEKTHGNKENSIQNGLSWDSNQGLLAMR